MNLGFDPPGNSDTEGKHRTRGPTDGVGGPCEVIGRPESLMTDLLDPDSAAAFAQLPHWTTLARRDGADQGERGACCAWAFL